MHYGKDDSVVSPLGTQALVSSCSRKDESVLDCDVHISAYFMESFLVWGYALDAPNPKTKRYALF